MRQTNGKERRAFTRIMFFPLAFLLSYFGAIANATNQVLRKFCAVSQLNPSMLLPADIF